MVRSMGQAAVDLFIRPAQSIQRPAPTWGVECACVSVLSPCEPAFSPGHGHGRKQLTRSVLHLHLPWAAVFHADLTALLEGSLSASSELGLEWVLETWKPICQCMLEAPLDSRKWKVYEVCVSESVKPEGMFWIMMFKEKKHFNSLIKLETWQP